MIRLLRAGIALACLCAIGTLIVSFLPRELVKSEIESLVPGHALALTAERFTAVRSGCQLTALMLFFIAAVLLGYRRQIPVLYAHLRSDGRRCWRIWMQDIASYVRDPWSLWPVVILFFLGLFLRVAQISRPAFLDEAFAYFSYWKHSLLWGISDYSSSNNHLFHSFLVFLSTRVFGDSLVALRLPALVGGLLMIPATFAVTAALYSRTAAIAATALVASAPPLIDFSAKARGYTWQCLFLLLTVLFACRIGRTEDTRFDWLGLVLAATLSLFTIPTSVVPVVAIAFWLTWINWERGGWSSLLLFSKTLIPALLGVAVLTMVLYIPAVIVSGPEAILANRFVVPMTPAEFRTLGPRLAGVMWVRWNDGVPSVARAIIYAGFVIGLAAHRRIARHRVPLAPPMILLCAAFVVTRRVAIHPRVWMFLWMFSLMTAGAGIAFVLSTRWRVTTFALIIAAVIGIAAQQQGVYVGSYTETGNVQGLAEAAEWMEQHLDSRDRIIGSSTAGPPLDYLLRQRRSRLETQIECVTSGLPMCGGRAIITGPPPRRLIAVIAKKPSSDDGHATDPALWHVQEAIPATIMFIQNDRSQYMEPRMVRDQIGVAIWEAWNVSVAVSERHD